MELFFLLMLVVIMAGALGSGYPVAFALPGAAILTIGAAAATGYVFAGDTSAYFSNSGPSQWLSAGVTNLRGVYWEPERDTLIAIPLFIFMGIMLQRSKIAEDLLVTMAQLFGPVPGGLGISVVVVGALLAATTGIVGATVVAMGMISLPAMMRNGYSNALSTGTIAASGTLGQIIPPSIVLIILADQLASAVDQAGQARQALYRSSTGELSMPTEFAVSSTSAGDMFLGAMIPGLLLVLLYIVFILVVAIVRPKLAPAVPYEGKYDTAFLGNVLLAMIPPLALILLVLGSIIAGIATVNQAGAIGAVGAMIMAGYRLHPEGRGQRFTPAIIAIVGLGVVTYALSNYDTNVLNMQTAEDRTGVTIAAVGVALLTISIIWSGIRAFFNEDALRGVMVETAKTTSLVFIILLGAAMLTAAFRAFGGEELVKHFLEGLPGGFWTKFIIVMVVIFVLGFFLDFIEIAVVVVPIVAPILLADPEANITAVWLGVMIGLNIQTSFLTPPFGFALFYLRGVAPAAVKTIQIYKGVVAFIGLQLAALVIVAFNPPLVNYLPARTSLISENAPPPVNPALQYCIEEFVAEQFAANSATISSAIQQARALDVSYLPEDLVDDWTDGLDKAEQAMPMMQRIVDATAAQYAAAEDYREPHTFVRALERDARMLEPEIEELRLRASRGFGDPEAQLARADMLQAERDALLAQIPATWPETQEAYAVLNRENQTARNMYRRNVDQAYEPVPELRGIIASADALAALGPQIDALAADALTMDAETADVRFREVESALGDVAGARDIRGLLSDARNEIDDRSPDPERGLEYVVEAQELFAAEVAWRTRAATELLPGLIAYDEAIQGTIGLRQQSRLPRETALYVAGCSARHRDISLNF
ncbi:C4-dicarboxylate ABC transporter permease [Loktanella sp. 3ANDIMAR09]|uniref:TRAP transporter large permease n=1 Tax=Loktanella sp. 3ANDIMAR09 TaxID=1225657 RepID=UPI0006F5C60A|nr:TRAP transporter large permease subunit [Loktanella sp. 3ANDIMAR09]KQI67919.1 C4-dicarboxylate ABC transporter permease [Loktanella sp. 3ANDIMAR09]